MRTPPNKALNVFCSRCGARAAEAAVFCTQCGTRLPAKASSEPVGFAGWLVFFLFSLIIGVIRGVWQLFAALQELRSTDGALLWMLGAYYAYCFLWVCGAIWCLVLAGQRSTWFPGACIGLLVSAVVCPLLLVGLAHAVIPDPVTAGFTLGLVLPPLVTAAIWVPYLAGSRRVHNTFRPAWAKTDG